MHSIEELKIRFDKALELTEYDNKPAELYEPIKYIMSLGGKRVRPVCTLAACELFGGEYKLAINQAIAVEVFHNFTLVHDDIMDHADLRRGNETVHKKWNNEVAILSGDAMMILAYQYMQKASEDKIHNLLAHFNRTAIKVCEGQQWDMNFETSKDVTLDDYMSMITKKTAVLLGEALRMGAIMAGASETDQELIYDFGKNFGIAFQIQDDILDLYGDPEKFGKKPGGDVLEGKKTYLYLKALEIAGEENAKEIHDLYYSDYLFADEKVNTVRSKFDAMDIKSIARSEMNRYYVKAGVSLNSIDVPSERKNVLKELAESLMIREL